MIEAIDPAMNTLKPPVTPASNVAAREALKRVSNSTVMLGEQTILLRVTLKSVAFEIRVTGDVGAKDIGNLIKILEAQKLILSDEEAETDIAGLMQGEPE